MNFSKRRIKMNNLKPSGIEWIGSIPVDWKTVPIYYVAEEVTTKNKTLLRKNAFKFFFCNIINKPNFNPDEDNYVNKTIRNYIIVNPGDIVINGLNLNFDFVTKRVGMVTRPGTITSAYISLRPKANVILPKYMLYILRTYDSEKAFHNMGGGVRKILNYDELSKSKIILPSISAQTRIIKFLDKKVSQIDDISKKIQQEITDLEEYRNSIIVKAVTKGLNPNVLMKDSGIPWIGKIPQQWNIEPIYLHFYQGKNKNNLGKEKNLLSLSYGKIIRKNINSVGGLLPSSYNTYNSVEAGDIIIRPTDLQNDKRSLRTGLVTEHGIITSAYLDLKPKTKNSSRYYHYLLHAYDIQKVFYNMGNGVRQGLNFSEFSKLKILVPNLKNQLAISDYLDNLNKKISKIILNKKSQLEKLNQYKQSIIYEYVTGKKQVPTEEGAKE